MTDITSNRIYCSHKFWYYVIMSVFALAYFITAIGNHYLFRTTNEDYGVYNFAFWDYAHFHISKCSVLYYTNMNFLQDHFSLTLMYFVPVYWLINWLTGTYTLAIIQVVMILVGGWATYRLIVLKTSDAWLGIASLVYYFLLQGHYSIFEGECNIAVISASFIPMFLYYFELKKYILASVIFVLAIFSRENIPLWFISILLIVMLWHRKDKKILMICSAFILASLVYFALLFKVIIPHFETAEKHYNLFNYSALGDTPYEAFKYVLKHPFNTARLFFINQSGDAQYNGVKNEFYLIYLISGGFMLFLRPQYFIWFIPLIAQKMLNDEPIRWSIEVHYAIEVVTMLPIAVFIIMSTLKKGKLKYILSTVICAMTLFMTAYKMDIKHREITWAKPIKESMFHPGFFTADYNSGKIHQALSLIPADAKVSASASIVPHLAQRSNIYEFPQVDDAQYIAVFSFHDYYNVGEGQYNQEFYKYVFSPEWKIIADEYPFILFKKEHRSTGVNEVDSITCNNDIYNSDKKNLVASNGEMISSPGTLDSIKIRNGKYSCKITKDNPYGMTMSDTAFTTGTLLAVSIWRYAENDSNRGYLVISCGKDFYLANNIPVSQDSKGWKELFAYVRVPADHSNFKIYAWNSGNTPVWFDDLKIVRYKGKLL
ncbi:MAG: DUF2079 domain-containing protein [Bacteroidia bacterium]